VIHATQKLVVAYVIALIVVKSVPFNGIGPPPMFRQLLLQRKRRLAAARRAELVSRRLAILFGAVRLTKSRNWGV
jgi:hypothetical protein